MIKTVTPGNLMLFAVCAVLGCTNVSEHKGDEISLGMSFSEGQRFLARHNYAKTTLAPWEDPGKRWSMHNYELPGREILTLFVLHETEDVVGAIGVVSVAGSTNFINRGEVHRIELLDREQGGGHVR